MNLDDSNADDAELAHLLGGLTERNPLTVAHCEAARLAGRCTAAGCAPDHDGAHAAMCCGAEWVCAAAPICTASADASRPHYLCGRCPSTACDDCRGAICTFCRPLDAAWAPLCSPCRDRRWDERRAREKAEREQRLVDWLLALQRKRSEQPPGSNS